MRERAKTIAYNSAKDRSNDRKRDEHIKGKTDKEKSGKAAAQPTPSLDLDPSV